MKKKPHRPAAASKRRRAVSPALANLALDAPGWTVRVVHQDSQIIVVEKPSGMSTVPYEGARGATERGSTLVEVVAAQVGGRRLEVVQRLDRETSGLIVFARTREAAQRLGNQFRFHRVHRRYVAVAHGDVPGGTLRSVLIENRGDGLRGSAPPGWRVAPGEGKEAVTHVRTVERLTGRDSGGGASLIECELETGRTHQIRIHLSEAGYPLLGERLYVREYEGAVLPAPRVMLHAAELGFEHPTSGAWVEWRSEMPEDFVQVLAGLRG